MPIVILLLWPLLEIAGFAWIGGAIGVAATLGFVVLSAVCGLTLLRRAGLKTLMQLRRQLERGETALPAMLDGAWHMVTGVLLVLPGFFSSALAVLLLVPPIRTGLTALLGRFVAPSASGTIRFFHAGSGRQRDFGAKVIEGEFLELTPAETDPPPGG